MGNKSDDILATFGLTKFDSYFVKRRNIIYKRAKFNRCERDTSEPVDSFITDLYGLAEHCQFGLLHDEMICDRIVVGPADQKLPEKLQLDADLTLEKAFNSIRQSESVKSQQSGIMQACLQLMCNLDYTRNRRRDLTMQCLFLHS